MFITLAISSLYLFKYEISGRFVNLGTWGAQISSTKFIIANAAFWSLFTRHLFNKPTHAFLYWNSLAIEGAILGRNTAHFISTRKCHVPVETAWCWRCWPSLRWWRECRTNKFEAGLSKRVRRTGLFRRCWPPVIKTSCFCCPNNICELIPTF